MSARQAQRNMISLAEVSDSGNNIRQNQFNENNLAITWKFTSLEVCIIIVHCGYCYVEL